MNELNEQNQDHEHGAPPEQPKPPKTVTVKVNNKDVTFEDHKTTGLQIKKTAIDQAVQIQEDFALFEVLGGDNNENLKPVKDNDPVTLHPNQRFRAVSADDSSSPELLK